MNTAEDSKRRFEILKMAKEMLHEEYTLKRATEHNKWLADSQELWTKHHITMAHPDFAPYPTDKDVLTAAQTLYNFISNDTIKIQETDTMKQINPVETIEKHDDRHNNDGHTGNKHSSDDIKPSSNNTDIHTHNDNSMGKEDPERVKDLLPGWLRRTK